MKKALRVLFCTGRKSPNVAGGHETQDELWNCSLRSEYSFTSHYSFKVPGDWLKEKYFGVHN